MKTKRKNSPLRFSSVFGPNLGEDHKEKGHHSDLVRFCAQTFCPGYKGGVEGHAAILHIILC